ncbi:MAG TPA: hydroxymethylbilane synthase [Thermoanaerobaculia bacterium]|nr:hydroxymethylbilane synthase [Thermoanaerobaculia bacterium]
MKRIRLGTRGSPLALWQANETARLLRAQGFSVELIPIRTTGDIRRDVPLAAIGGKGLFVKELETALDRDEIDLAVHSLKDVPSIVPERFTLAGFLERADPRDAWLQPDGLAVDALPHGALIATSAPRRRAQLLARRPDLRIEPIRGNVETRLAKLQNRACDGLVVASAGLTRLGLTERVTATFSVDEMIPAAGQGIVALESLQSNALARSAAQAITHTQSAIAARCERGVLQHFGTQLDCLSCIAVHASFEGETIVVRAFVSDLDAATIIRVTQRGTDAEALACSVADELRERGAISLLEVCAA